MAKDDKKRVRKPTNRGRRKKPTELKKRDGNPGRRRLPEKEPEAEVIDATGPIPVEVAQDADALAFWEEYLPILRRWKLLTAADKGLFVGLCMTYSIRERAFRSLKDGLDFTTPKGYVQQRPGVAEFLKANKMLADQGAHFGLTPSGRAGLEIPDGEDKRAEDAFFGFG